MKTVINFFKNLLVFIVAILLYLIIAPFAMAYMTIKLLFTNRKDLIRMWSEVFFSHALGLDQTANGSFYIFFNAMIIKDDTKFPFGSIDETISSVIGRNKQIDNLTIAGKVLDFILSLLDPNHSIKSIGS